MFTIILALARQARRASLLAFIASIAVSMSALAAGTWDNSFSGDGRTKTDFRGGQDRAHGIAVQSNGKVIVVGGTFNASAGEWNFALARYNANGTFDATFDGDGKKTVDLGGSEEASRVAVQADGKIVIAGTTCGDAGCDLAVVRLRAGGGWDTTFSGDGKQIVDFNAVDNTGDGGLAIQSDGKIVIAGSVGDPADFAVYRLNPDGSLDSTFSGDGMRSLHFGADWWCDWPHGIAIQRDGKILVGGTTSDCGFSESYFAVARLRSGGTLDPTFSGDGLQTTKFSSNADALGMTLQSGGKVILAGLNGGRFALARYTSAGALDSTFSSDGKVTTAFSDNYGAAEAIIFDVKVQPDGKIVVAGRVHYVNTGDNFALARYNANGTLDSIFGKKVVDFDGDLTSDNDSAEALAIQPDGKYVLAGYDEGDFAVGRFLP